MLILFLFILLLLPACGDHHYAVQPKANPKNNVIKPREKRSQTAKQLPAPERRKVQRKDTKERETRIAQHSYRHMNELTIDQLKGAKQILLEEQNDKETALKYVERMLVIATDLNDLKELRLEIADLNFDLGKLEEAEKLYNDYINFYPSSEMTEYASYKAILSAYYQTLSSDRDQSKTQQALNLAESFLKRESFKSYSDDVKVIQQQCLARAFESEVNVFNFYISQDKLSAAQSRISYIKERFPVNQLHLEPYVIALEVELARRQGNEELVKQKELELAQFSHIQEIKQLLEPVVKKRYVAQF